MRILLPIFLTAAAALVAVILQRPESPVPLPSPLGRSPAGELVIAAATPPTQQAQAFMLPAVQPAYAPVRNTSVPDPVPDANAAVVYHPETDTSLFAKNETVRAPIASLTKVLTALVVNDLLMPDEIVTVSSASVRADGEKQTLYAGERLRVRDLVVLMLVESSNDAASALTQHLAARGTDLVAEMNLRARELGMLDSRFTHPAGLDDGAYSTARDLVRLVRAAQRTPELWSAMRLPEVSVASVDGSITHTATNTNQLLAEVPGILWGKTGNTDGALGCMILVMEIPGKHDTIVSIVLGSRARFADTKLLVHWAQSAWRWPR